MQQDVPEDDTVFVVETETGVRSLVADSVGTDDDRNLVFFNGRNEVVALFADDYWKSVIRNKVITE